MKFKITWQQVNLIITLPTKIAYLQNIKMSNLYYLKRVVEIFSRFPKGKQGEVKRRAILLKAMSQKNNSLNFKGP